MLSIVLPCFNEEPNIERSVRDTAAWLQTKEMPWEILVVDDGSTDGTAAMLERLKREISSLIVVRHAVNQGYGVAVRSGCDQAKGDIIGFMDSDGQFRPSDFDLLLPKLTNCAFVTGRRGHRADPLIRCLFGKMLGAMNVIVLGLWVRDINCGMKIFRRDVWKDVRPVYGVEKLFNTEVFLRLKRNHIPWCQVNVPHYPRRAGKQTGGSLRVIFRMFWELWRLKYAPQSEANATSASSHLE
jgi:glycosyltransferase involved in cell wall biosynthesis